MSRPYEAEKFEHKGFTVRIVQEEDARAPENDETDLFIVTTRNRYFQLLHEGQDATQMMGEKESRKEWEKKYWVFPLRAYIHSGVALSLYGGYPFNDQWDSGQIGFVFVDKKVWRYRNRKYRGYNSASESAESYVKEWNTYLSGDVWWVVVEEDGEQVDSVGWVYGLEEAKKEGVRMAEDAAQDRERADRMEKECYAL